MRKYEMILAKMLAVILMGFFLGCTGPLFKNMGRFEPSTAATQNFEKFVVHNDYNYFLTGSDVYPVAIFGLKKAYIIDSDEDLWKKLTRNRKSFRNLSQICK